MARIERTLTVAALAAFLLAPQASLAKGKQGGKDGKGKDKDVMLTGFKSFDKVFREIGDIDERIDGAETALRVAKRDLNLALGLQRGTPLKDAIADLKVKGGDNLSVAMTGKVPKLAVTDAVPQNLTDAVDAVNGLTTALITSIDDLSGIPAEVGALTKAIERFPAKAKDEFSGDLIGSLFKAPKLLKSIKGNAEITASLPKRSKDVSERATSIVSLVSTEFQPGGDRQTRGEEATNPRVRR